MMEKVRFTLNFGLLLLLELSVNVGYFAWTIDPANVSVLLDESGAIEAFQLAYVSGAAVFFFAAGMMRARASRMFCIGMAVLCTVFFFRELEIDKIGPITGYLNSKIFRSHEAILVVGLALVYLVFRWQFVGEMMRFVFSTAAWPFYVAAVFLLIGAYCDTRHGSVLTQLIEEVSESCSYLSLLGISAGLCYQYSRNRDRKKFIDIRSADRPRP